MTGSSSQSDSESCCSNIAGTEIDIERDVPQKTTFLFYKKVSQESHKNEQKKKFADMDDNREVKQEEPKTKKTKTIDRNTSQLGSFKYETKFSTVWSSTRSCIQPVDADVYAAFCTVYSCKVNYSHQGAGDIRRHVDSKKHKAYAKSLQSQERIRCANPTLKNKVSKII